jgi:two-component system OmpR family response regulator
MKAEGSPALSFLLSSLIPFFGGPLMSPPARLLLIDDDPVWLDTLAEFLGQHGFAVVTAGDGRVGLSLAEQSDVSLAIVDYHLAGMNGLEILRELRRRRQDLAVLMISGDDEPSVREQALAEGARAMVPKTASPRFLLQMIQESLTPRRALPPSALCLLPAPSPSRS